MQAYRLADGVEKNRQNPDTYEIPSDSDKAALKVGDVAKLGRGQDVPVRSRSVGSHAGG